MNWISLHNIQQLSEIEERSFGLPQVIFKHSTRCSISLMVKSRLEREDAPDGIDFYYLDLLNHRDVSNAIAENYQVHHESPQILLIKNKECLYAESQTAITMSDLLEQIEKA